MKQGLLSLCAILLLSRSAVAAVSPDDHLLDVSIQVFSQADVPQPKPDSEPVKTKEKAPAKPEPVAAVHATETRLLPMYLRYKLESSGNFGAVRVVPTLDNGAELRISGQIIKSDGEVLDLAIKAEDSTGRIWLDRIFHGSAMGGYSLKNDQLPEDDFGDLFGAVSTALKQELQKLDERSLDNIKSVALLRYGLGLVPSAFSPYLEVGSSGIVNLKRLPASDDPLMKRILNIRNREYEFIDVVDQEYARFYTSAKPLYSMWRQAQREEIESSTARNESSQADQMQFARGSYFALKQSYNNYRWVKLQELYVDELGEGFTNEIEPTQLQLNDSVFRLTGTLDQQYRDWRNILVQLFELEGK